MRTQPFAVCATNQLYRQSQQDLLFEHVFQQQAFASIVPDFSFRLCNSGFVTGCIHALRAVEQVKRLTDIALYRVQTPGTANFQPGGHAAHQANIFYYVSRSPGLPDQFGAARGMDRNSLPDFLSQINRSRLKALIEFKFPEFKFLYFYEHRATPECCSGRERWRTIQKLG